MKPYGDTTKAQREHAKDLLLFEQEVDTDTYPNDKKAMLFACLAHDYLEMDQEESANRLLKKAETISPGYFEGTVLEHMAEDKTFEEIMENISRMLALIMIQNLKDRT